MKRRQTRRRRSRQPWHVLARVGIEVSALAGAALVGIIAVLGSCADRFAGGGWSHLLPFAGAVLGISVVIALLLRVWFALRRWSARRVPSMSALLALALAAAAGWAALQPRFGRAVTGLRTLVGGAVEAERIAIGHQVYAAYRRSDLEEMARVFERARIYESTVHDAAREFRVDPEVLMGIGAAESSFYPRDSHDGGRGLFQITAPPEAAVLDVRRQLGVDRLDMLNQRHNAFVAAATLRHYLTEMRGDLFLALLAYNIGPRNGGLRSIMQQYGARDFVTIQPYLQQLPRDYPIRALSAALAYRLWRTEGRLPHYEEANNAVHIQSIGVPGL